MMSIGYLIFASLVTFALAILILRSKILSKIALGSIQYRFVYFVVLLMIFVAGFIDILLIIKTFVPADLYYAPLYLLGAILLLEGLYKAFKRFGTSPHYVTVIYSSLFFLVALYFMEKLFLASNLELGLPSWLLNLGVGFVIFLFWTSFALHYKVISLWIPAIVGLLVPFVKLLQHTIVFYLAPVYMLYTIIIYIYMEFVHPYPTLFDKYVFDKPRHFLWGSLVVLGGILLLVV